MTAGLAPVEPGSVASEGSEIQGAFWSGLDFVAVQYGHVTGCSIHGTGDDAVVHKVGRAIRSFLGGDLPARSQTPAGNLVNVIAFDFPGRFRSFNSPPGAIGPKATSTAPSPAPTPQTDSTPSPFSSNSVRHGN